MRNDLLRRLAELERARRGPPAQRPEAARLGSWVGRAVFDPSGMRLGHVIKVARDDAGGAWIDVNADWGILDWLFGMGAGHPHFTFHSDDFEERGEKELVIRESVAHATST
jgi:hypothetical protein